MKPEEYMQEIKRLKEERDAIILAHYYTDDKLQEIADYVGDSYSIKSSKGGKRASYCFLWCKIHGRKCKNLKSTQNCFITR